MVEKVINFSYTTMPVGFCTTQIEPNGFLPTPKTGPFNIFIFTISLNIIFTFFSTYAHNKLKSQMILICVIYLFIVVLVYMEKHHEKRFKSIFSTL